MKLLFVSMTTVGGSGRSQRELAKQLSLRSHDVLFLVAGERLRPGAAITRWAYGHISDLSVRLRRAPGSRLVVRIRDSMGRRTVATDEEGLPHLFSTLPQNSLSAVMTGFVADAVVVSSVDRWTWRLIHAVCSAADVATVLYIREDDSLDHLSTEAVPTVLLANAESLTAEMRARGFDCVFIPSVVDTSVTRTESTRRAALAINPVTSRGIDLVWRVARRLPRIPFVIQESWPLDEMQRAEVDAHLSECENVEFRAAQPPGPDLYGDARVVLVPYRVDNRPRVILEAQANGIPTIVADVPALVEAVGEGGVVVPLDSTDAWVDAIVEMWECPDRYSVLVAEARSQARRAEVDPEQIARRFERVLNEAFADQNRRRKSSG